MGDKKRHWVWNFLIGVTLVLCIIAFTAHYKNWIRVKQDHFTILSGIYYKKLHFSSLNSVTMVDKLPSMERISGFSAWTTEKGVFRDSLYPGNKVYVFVDNLNLPKLKLLHEDSLVLFLNLQDSTETYRLFEFLKAQKDSLTKAKTKKK